MDNIFQRNMMLWGKEFQQNLANKHVMVFGLGGVGGFALEALARAGVGNFTLIDFDEVSSSNINRQVIALHSTLGQKKTKLFEERLKDINPKINIRVCANFYSKEMNEELFVNTPDFVVDAIDTMRSKIDLLDYCHKNNIPVISSIGAGNRLDPTKLFIADISEIGDLKCNFVKNILYQLKKREITSGLTVVASSETPLVPKEKIKGVIRIADSKKELYKVSPGSNAIVPAVAGYYLAFYVLKTFSV